MPGSKKYILIVSVAVLALVAAYIYKEYHRQPGDVSGMDTEATINASKLIEAFKQDETSANKIYLGKAIEVNGSIAEILNQADTMINIALGSPNNFGKVSCLIDASHLMNAMQLKVGDSCIIKGICTGYLMDVELNRCMIIK